MRSILFQKFTASLIMTPRKQWVCWERGSSISTLVKDNGKLVYDVIPVEENGKIIGIVRNPNFNIEPITLDWCLTHDTPIDSLLDFFIKTQKPACFLLKGDDLVGLVTPADFNKASARAMVYIRLAELEIQLGRFLHNRGVREKQIFTVLSSKRKKELQSLHRIEKEKNVDVSIIERLFLKELFLLIKKYHLYHDLAFDNEEEYTSALEELNNLRNQIMHPVNILVEDSHNSLKKLKEDLELMEVLIGRLQSQ